MGLPVEVPEFDQDGRPVTRPRTLDVCILAGVAQGQQIRLAAQGSAGTLGAAARDMFL